MIRLHPITCIVLLLCTIINSQVNNAVINIIFFLFIMVLYSYFKKYFDMNFDIRIYYILIIFSLLFLISYRFNVENMLKLFLILLKIINIILYFKLLAHTTLPSDWASLMQSLGFNNLLLSISVAFNIIPFLRGIFRDFIIRISNYSILKRMLMFMRLPYVFTAYSLIYAYDVNMAYYARGMHQNPPSYARLRLPNFMNILIMVISITIILWGIIFNEVYN